MAPVLASPVAGYWMGVMRVMLALPACLVGFGVVVGAVSREGSGRRAACV